MQPYYNDHPTDWDRGKPTFILVEDNPSFRPFYALVTDVGEDAFYFESLFEIQPGTHVTITAESGLAQPAQHHAIVTRCRKLTQDKSPFKYRIAVQYKS
ncbi:MAG: hypothetical protein PVF14_17500 [Desulfobacterales bacterium]